MQFRSTLVCFATAVACAHAADSLVIEEIIAKVNGDIITRSELDRDRKGLETELKARGVSGPNLQREVSDRSKDVLRERIDGLLLVSKAKELNISVDSEVSKYIADLQLQSKITDPEKFQTYVREQTGQSYEDYKNEIRNTLMRQRVVRDQVGRTVNIPKAEQQKYYEEHKSEFVREERIFLREIFLSLEGKTPAETAAIEKKAKDLAARARKGERFGEMAKSNSDSATKDQFGDLGGFKKTELDDQILAAVWGKDRGFVADPIRRANPAGFEILRVEDSHKAGQATFEEVENDIMEKLYMPKFQPKIREYLTQLRTEAFLEIKPGYTDSGAAPNKPTGWADPAQLKPETITKEEVASHIRRKRALWMVPVPGTGNAGMQRPNVSSSK